MNKGQIYILTASIIIISITTIANIGLYSSTPVVREQSSMSNTGAIMHNINNEISYVISINATHIDDFINITEKYGEEKGLDIEITG